MTRRDIQTRTRAESDFALAAPLGARSAAERKPRQQLAAVRGVCHNHDRIYPIRRGSFPFSARLGTRRVAMAEANGSGKFAPERYRAYLHLLARLNLPRRLRSVLSASDLAHDTILKA